LYDEELAGNSTVCMDSWNSEIQPTGLVEAPLFEIREKLSEKYD